MKTLNLELLYTDEHRRCPCYSACGTEPLIDKIRLHEKEQYTADGNYAQIMIVYKGQVHIRLKQKEEFTASEGYMFLLPGSVPACICADTQSQILCFSLQGSLSLCSSFRLQELTPYVPTVGRRPYLLPVNDALSCYLGGLLPFLDSGLRCRDYLHGKIDELLFCLRGYYTKENLAAFLCPILSEDFIFRDRVYACMRNNLKVGELAQEMGMCYASLINLFYRVFGTSPKEFIDTYKKQQLLEELKTGIKPLKTLPSEYGFGSYSAFTRFCISQLNARPTEIRSESIRLRER